MRGSWRRQAALGHQFGEIMKPPHAIILLSAPQVCVGLRLVRIAAAGSSSNAHRRKRQRWSLLAQPWLGSFGRCGAGLHCTAGDCTLAVSAPEYCRLHCTALRRKAQNNIRVAHSTAYDMKSRTTHTVQPTGNVRYRVPRLVQDRHACQRTRGNSPRALWRIDGTAPHRRFAPLRERRSV